MSTLQNIFDFDTYNPQLRRYLVSIFQKHGIPLMDTDFDHQYSV